MRYGHGEAADRLLSRLAEEIAENPGFQHISIFTIDEGTEHATTFTRGLNDSNRLDGYGITKAHVTLAKRELAKLGVTLPFDEVDGLLHHAEAHRSGACDCQGEAATQPNRGGMTSAEKSRAFRARAKAKGWCARGGKAHGKAKQGTICKACLAYDLERKRARRYAAKLAEAGIFEIA